MENIHAKAKDLLAEYGQVALIMHLLLYACTFIAVFIVIHIGLKIGFLVMLRLYWERNIAKREPYF